MDLPVRLTKLHEPDKNYMIRVCMLVVDATEFTATSVIEQCEECGQDIWVDVKQVVPPPPEGMTIEGEVRLCLRCTAIHAAIDDVPQKWLGPSPT